MLCATMSPTQHSRPGARTPRRVLLFSGHRVDAAGRAVPRFPPEAVVPAARRIESLLDRVAAGAHDLAITQGAAGGDLLFAHACQRRGIPLRLMLPLAEPAFVRCAVTTSAEAQRWLAAWRHVRAGLAEPPQRLPGSAAGPGNRFERCNEWMLDHALALGAREVELLCLWDGAEGDGPGGTAHLVDAARRRGVPVHWIDVRTLC